MIFNNNINKSLVLDTKDIIYMSKNDEYDIIIIKLKKVEEYIIIWN